MYFDDNDSSGGIFRVLIVEHILAYLMATSKVVNRFVSLMARIKFCLITERRLQSATVPLVRSHIGYYALNRGLVAMVHTKSTQSMEEPQQF